jgi:uncharacterized glyoxalase superfamily protein PhnB
MIINKSTPILHVETVEPGLQFWTERFGFNTTIQVPEGDHIGFAAIDNGTVELMYQTYEGMKDAGPLAEAVMRGPTFIFMEVSDINAIKQALQQTEIVQDIHETFYGAQEIVAQEPGGHYVIFSQLPAPTNQ